MSAWVLQMQSLLGNPVDADIVKMVVREPRCLLARPSRSNAHCSCVLRRPGALAAGCYQLTCAAWPTGCWTCGYEAFTYLV